MKTMTKAALEANRANAARSTGPRTAEGKAAVAQNNLRHGLTAWADLVPGEDQEAFDRLKDGLLGQLAPAGELEAALVGRVASCLWRLWRAQRIEAGVLAYERRDAKNFPATSSPFEDPMTDQQQRADLPTWGLAFIRDCHGAGALEKLTRYEGAIERSLFRALHQLERLQRSRAGEDLPAPAVLEVNLAGPGGPGGFEL